jgi:hypothetical protein
MVFGLRVDLQDYIAHIEEQHERLKSAWDNGERVLALKIAIQVSLSFYESGC